MGSKLLSKWESLPPRRQVAYATPTLLVLLFGFHEAFFPLLEWTQSLTYAVMECVPLALVVTFATQTELTRRAQHANQTSEPSTPTPAPGQEPELEVVERPARSLPDADGHG